MPTAVGVVAADHAEDLVEDHAVDLAACLAAGRQAGVPRTEEASDTRRPGLDPQAAVADPVVQ